MAKTSLIVSDFIVSFMWVWSSVLRKVFLYTVLNLGHDLKGDVINGAFYIINLFFFAYLGKLTRGGTYNPLTVLASAFSGGFTLFLFTVGARIPSQVMGSIIGVRFVIKTFPEVRLGEDLNVGINHGALTEGLLAFAIVSISLCLTTKIPGSFYRKTWISSVSKLTLQILSSDFTGGYMNPAYVMGWAYASGKHLTKEHILVYWVAPVQATMLAVWTFRLVVKPLIEGKEKLKAKSE